MLISYSIIEVYSEAFCLTINEYFKTVENVNVSENLYGFDLRYVFCGDVSKCVATNNVNSSGDSFGFKMIGSKGVSFENCKACQNKGENAEGFCFDTCNSIKLISCNSCLNTATDGITTGIKFSGGENNRVQECVVNENISNQGGDAYGFCLMSTSIFNLENSVSRNNVATGSFYNSYGFGLFSSTYLSIKKCSSWSDDYGFYDDTSGLTNTFLGNTATNNSQSSFHESITTKEVHGTNPAGAMGIVEGYDNLIFIH